MKLYKYLYLLPSFAFMVTSCDLDEIPEGGTITSDQKDEIQSKDPSENGMVVRLTSILVLRQPA